MEAILIGDLHIGRLQSLFPHKNWPDMTLAPLRQIEEYARHHGVQYAIQTGDIFDIPNPSQELLQLLTRHLLASPLHYYFGIGNHDISHRGSHSLVLLNYLAQEKRLRNCLFFPQEARIKLDNIPVVFLPWPKTTSRLLNRPSLVVAHVERKGMRYDSGRIITEHEFALDRHIWAIGHLHEFQTDDNLIFPGSLSQLRYGDGEAKYFVHLKINRAGKRLKMRYKRIRLVPQFILRDLQINSLADLKALDTTPENVYIRLLIHQDVAVPVKFINHPQVLKHRFFGDKRDLRAIQADQFNLQIAQATQQSRKRALKTWLRQSGKLPKERIRYALQYAETLENQVLK